MGHGCHAGCIHRTIVRDGKIVGIENVTLPDGQKETMCVKGVASARMPYNADRLKYPLKRAGKRGEGKWQRVTWEQALREIADRILENRQKYGPESIGISPVWNSSNPRFGLQLMLGTRLRNLLQAVEINFGQPIDSNQQFSNFFTFGTPAGTFADPETLVEGKTKYMIAWGINPAETAFRFWEFIRAAQKAGAKLVDVGLLFDSTSKKADWWIPVRAGSDAALAMAMIGVIIKGNLYDEDYLMKYTNAPFLVRSDNGRCLREIDVLPAGDSQKYLIWDAAVGAPRGIGAGESELDGTRPALFGKYVAGGIECRPAFQVLAELADSYKPAEVEQITGVSNETVVRLATEYATAKPASILTCYGLRYKNSGNAYRAMAILGALTGNVGVLGGGPILGLLTQGMFNAPALKLNDRLIENPTDVSTKAYPIAELMRRMITGKPIPIKVLMLYSTNLLHTFPDRKRWIEKILPNLDLFVVDDIFMTATAEYADFVLPDCTVFEREDIDISHGGYLTYLGQAIEPMWECRPPIYLWTQLANRLGLAQYFDKSFDEWMDFRFDSKDPSVASLMPRLSMERLRTEKMIRPNVPKQVNHPFLDKRFTTPSGRIEIYCERLVAAEDALPVYREPLEGPCSSKSEKYPLVFNTANNKYFAHTMFANEPSIQCVYKNEAHVSINPADAMKRGIREEDIVLVYNDRGSCKLRATVTGAVPPGVVNIPHGWWPKHFIEGHLADLLVPLASAVIRDKAREIWWEEATRGTGGSIAMAGAARFAYSTDTLFDCLCEIRKV